MKKLYLLLGISLFLVFLSSLFQAVLDEDLQSSNRDLTIEIQKMSSGGTDSMFEVIDDYSPEPMILFAPADFMMFNRKRGFYGSLSAFASIPIYSILKNIYVQPRPYWIYGDIEAIACSEEWGPPSGHVMIAGCVFIYYMFFTKNPIVLTLYSLIILIVSFDRVFLGVHSYFHVVLGLCYSLLCAVLCKIAYNFDIINKKIFVIWVSIGVAVYFIISLTVFLYRDPDLETKWNINSLQKCEAELDKDVMMRDSFILCMFIFFFYGIYCGFFFLKNKGSEKKNWKYVVLGLALLVLLLAVFMVLEALIAGYVDGWVEILLYTIVREFTGFALMLTLPVVQNKILS